jgi:hypothetical protein
MAREQRAMEVLGLTMFGNIYQGCPGPNLFTFFQQSSPFALILTSRPHSGDPQTHPATVLSDK